MKDPAVSLRKKVGTRLEQLSHDVFDTFRWMLSIGGARYVAVQTDSALFLYVSYGLTVALLIFLISVFFLRGEVTVFKSDKLWVKASNVIVNILICILAFGACLWLTHALVNTFVLFQKG
ncbi:MAG: hypothetical protein ABJL72_03945 [Roseobacter sp.]